MDKSNVRTLLQIIRTPCTTPSTVLPNRQTAAQIAHKYLMEHNRKRNSRKRASR